MPSVAPRALDGRTVAVEGEADVGSADLVCALVALGHAAVVVGHAHLEDGDAQALDPVAETVLAVPFGVPVGEEEDGGAKTDFFAGGKELGVNGVVFGPGRFYGAGEGEDVVAIEAVIGGGRRGVPFPARFDGFAGVLADECPGIGLIGRTADVLEAPMEGLDTAIVVGGPAAGLVAAGVAVEPVHEGSCQLLVYSC